MSEAIKARLKRRLQKAIRMALKRAKRLGLIRTPCILLHCDSPVCANYLADFRSALSYEPRIKFAMHWPENRRPLSESAYNALVKKMGVISIRRNIALVFPWDLIVCADHVETYIYDGLGIPLLNIGHGSWAKIKKGESSIWALGKMGWTHHGEWRYQYMFCQSDEVRMAAEKEYPHVCGRIFVVGDMKNDKILALAKSRDEIRSAMSIQPSDRVILLLSSWGPDSLFHVCGEYLLREAHSLVTNGYKFIISIHPNEYEGGARLPGSDVSFGAHIESMCSGRPGFVVRPPLADNESFIVASDIVITDHTSAVEPAILLGRPIIASIIRDESLWVHSVRFKYRNIVPKLNCQKSLLEQVKSLSEDYPYETMREIAGAMHSYPGQGSLRIAKFVRQIVANGPGT